MPSGEPVKIRATIKRAPVWVIDKDGERIPGRMDIPEGWYALPDPEEEPPEIYEIER